MFEEIDISEDKILILQVNGRVLLFSGINAAILKKLFHKRSDWLSSVNVKLTNMSTDNLNATCIEVLSKQQG